MSTLVPNSPQRDSSSFRKVVAAFLFGEGLPFAEILSAERIQRIFAKHGCQFGRHGIYTAALVVFMMIALLLGQGTQTCARKHHLRHSDFRRGKRLGKYDHLIVMRQATAVFFPMMRPTS